MVDLSKARAGDTVKFRCGGQAVIEAIGKPQDEAVISFNGVDYNHWYTLGGLSVDSPVIDITEVIPAPVAFDWNTARWGMGFINGIGSVYIYCGGRGMATNDPIFYAKGTCDLRPIPTASLTRAPEHDVEAV